MLKQVEHESAPGMKISFGWEDFQNTNSFRMGISANPSYPDLVKRFESYIGPYIKFLPCTCSNDHFKWAFFKIHLIRIGMQFLKGLANHNS